jgi:hypothetical protein
VQKTLSNWDSTNRKYDNAVKRNIQMINGPILNYKARRDILLEFLNDSYIAFKRNQFETKMNRMNGIE